ncbi:MAG TPA: ATP-binding cassette domain-containing protein [Acetobacteraceae bacterium]|nr:ATP-binding cassette domain-containing protein [Acetobacteraceae bacterium]
MDAPDAEAWTCIPGCASSLDPDLMNLSWPPDRLGQALEALALRSGLRDAPRRGAAMPAAPSIETPAQAGNWLEWAAGHLGVEAEPVEFPLPELERSLMRACPMVCALHDGRETRFFLLLEAKGRSVALIGPDLRLHRRPVDAIRAAATARFEVPLIRDLDRLLDTAKVAPGRRDRVRAAMLRERLAGQMVGGCWLLRLPARAPFFAQLARAGLIRRLGWVVALLTGVYLVEIIGWALIGAAALDGRLDLAWLVAWLLLLVSNIPLRLSAAWFDATFALDLGRILKNRLLAGALRMDIDAVRHQGVGQLLGRVMESQALELLALNGGMTVLAAAVELMFSAWILTAGAGGCWHLLALLVWLAATSALCWRYHRRLRAWSSARLERTHELIEHMVGHRTRLAQEWPGRRDEAEDRSVRDYLELSRELDRAITPVAAGAAGGWAVAALLGLAPAFILGTASPAETAISLGGIMLANRAFAGISRGAAALSQAGVAWTLVSDLFRAARAPTEQTPILPPTQAGAEVSHRKLIEASGVVFRYGPERRAILRGLDLTIYQGEKILLEGASGGGKSTLASLLTGLRAPESGLLLLNGLDRPTLRSGWHRLATEAPQFHENHILTGPLAFNLLMGRDWPASEEDLREARALCVELGLGALLERMPAGLMQQVGETGWQLSHGERSRVFLARALLQDAPLTILDESFAALDPETLKACLRSAVAHARTLVVIAHP